MLPLPPTRTADLAAWLLGRPLAEEDGVPAGECAAAVQRLGCPLPTALEDFYLSIGRQTMITASFQRFLAPDAWTLNAGKLVFLEENQGICHWATDAQARVFQSASLDTPEWNEEPATLPEFLRVLLYYQMAQGGYPHCGMIPATDFSTPQEVQSRIDAIGARLVVDMAGLRIFVAAEQTLLWYLHGEDAMPEPGLFLSALREEEFQRISEEWLFDDLG
jgi:hypothetical protein